MKAFIAISQATRNRWNNEMRFVAAMARHLVRDSVHKNIDKYLIFKELQS